LQQANNIFDRIAMAPLYNAIVGTASANTCIIPWLRSEPAEKRAIMERYNEGREYAIQRGAARELGETPDFGGP
jgi:hypothetical protein